MLGQIISFRFINRKEKKRKEQFDCDKSISRISPFHRSIKLSSVTAFRFDKTRKKKQNDKSIKNEAPQSIAQQNE